jgi:Flp pilus assembly pilin Flp
MNRKDRKDRKDCKDCKDRKDRKGRKGRKGRTGRTDRPTGFDPTLTYLRTHLRGRIDRVRDDEDMSRGASAVEWVVISAIVVAIVAVVGFVIKQALNDKAADVSHCIGSTNGDEQSC